MQTYSLWYLSLFHVNCPARWLVHLFISWEHSDQWRKRTTSRSNYHTSGFTHTHWVPLMQKPPACHTERFRSNFRIREDPWGQRWMRKPQMAATFWSLKMSSPAELKQLRWNISCLYMILLSHSQPKSSLLFFPLGLSPLWEQLIYRTELRRWPSGSNASSF